MHVGTHTHRIYKTYYVHLYRVLPVSLTSHTNSSIQTLASNSNKIGVLDAVIKKRGKAVTGSRELDLPVTRPPENQMVILQKLRPQYSFLFVCYS